MALLELLGFGIYIYLLKEFYFNNIYKNNNNDNDIMNEEHNNLDWDNYPFEEM